MSMSYDAFCRNLSIVDDSLSTYCYLHQQSPNMDVSVLLRSQMVIIVSAFDTYIHSRVIDYIVKCYCTAGQNFEISIDIPLELAYEMQGLEGYALEEKLRTALIQKLRKDSFQSPKSIEYALGMIGIKKIWNRVGDELDSNGQNIKDQLSLIVKRRNQIAHESDWDSVNNSYLPISQDDVLGCLEFIRKLVKAIDTVIDTADI